MPTTGVRSILVVAALAEVLLCSVLARADTPPASPPALDKPPRMVHFAPAEPPARLAEVGNTDVILTLDVDATGAVTSATVAQSAGEDFDQAALAAARQFVFEPGEAGGKKVPVRITYRYRFILKPAEPSPEPETQPAAPVAPATPTVPFAGVILRKGDRVALVGISVLVDDGALQAVSDTAGRFTIPALPVGAHTVKLRGSGISPVDTALTANAGKGLEVTYYVQSEERYSSTVRGKRVVVETVETTLDVQEIKRIPGTQGDTLKAVQNLPGVARAPFGIGLLVVWGSSPFDTRTYVDGVFIPTLYHFGGLRSTLNSEMIQSLQFLPGGYSVDHGLGLGGVVDVGTRVPRRDGLHGYAQIDILDGSFGLEGPITKDLDFAFGVRRSWIDVFLPIFTTSDFQLSPIYWDYQARLVYRPTPRDDLSFLLFGSDDTLTLVSKQPNPALSAEFDSHNYYHRAVASWLHRFPGKATLSLTGSLGYDVPFQIAFTRLNAFFKVDAETLEYTARLVGRVPLESWLRLDAGLDFEGNRITIDRQAPLFGAMGGGGANGFGLAFASDNETLYTNHPAPFVSLNFSLLDDKLTLNPQFRLALMTFNGYPGEPQSFSSTYVRAEPRLALRYQLTPEVALKGAFGVYDQPPLPQDLSPVFGNVNLTPELAYHYVAGVDVRLTPTLTLSVEGFYKDLHDLVVTGERPTDPPRTNEGIGRVYGGELLLRQQLWKGFFAWISYTLSRSERRDHPDQDWHVFQFDQTHILNLTTSYELGKGYQVGLRFRYVTGNPSTPIVASYFDSNQNEYVGVQGPLYSTRLDPFVQLDFRFDKTWTYDRWRFSLYLDIQNLTNASNPEGVAYNFDFSKTSTVNGLPILPVLGIRGDF